MLKHFIILGAGISGLSLAWFLKKRFNDNIRITVLEKNHRVGGWIQTIKKDNFLFELGPRSCRPKGNGIETLRLIEDLGLQDQVILGNSSSKKRYIFLNQRLRSLPTGLFSLASSPFFWNILKGLVRDLLSSRSQNNREETIYEFTMRRLGKKFAEELIDPLTSGIYAGDIRRLSLKSCFPKLYEWEQQYGSVIKGGFLSSRSRYQSETPFIQEVQKYSLFSFKNGMETLTQKLASQLSQHLKLDCTVEQIQFHSNFVEVRTSNNEVFHGDHVFSTLPPSSLEKILGSSNPNLSKLLINIPNASVAVVSLGFKKEILKQKGFGYLIPSKEKEKILGVVWDSCVFPEQNFFKTETRLTVMIGGSHMLNFDSLTKNDFLKIAIEAIQKHLKIREIPDCIHVALAKEAIPQYLIGHEDLTLKIKQELRQISSGFTLLGNAFNGVSVNDCISEAKKICAGIELRF